MFSNHFRQLLGLCVLGGLLTAVTALNTVVTAQPPQLPPIPDERTLLPHFPIEEAEGNAGNSQQSPTMPSWSKGVFQSYRGNWEIYSSQPPFRLTYDDNSDIHPRYNRGATRIVFSSNRDGDYEIFAMNADGSGLQQLTHNDSIDVNPAWSPNGNLIVFQAYRDGQAEVYVMNADGSNETRLTVHAAYDGDPVWSPDGSKIAFRSARAGMPFIYVMNSDGSGVYQLSGQPSYYVAWSPDGSQIAYTADLDGDTFFEMWLMNADGSNQRMIYDPIESQSDAWVRGWSPDGREITFTHIKFIQYQGNWYWEWAYINSYDLATGNATRLDWTGREWNPDWQTTDATPPQSELGNLSPFSQIADFNIALSGADQQAGAGLATYDVQYRVGPNGPWVDWQMGVTATSAVYTAVPNTTVSFRSRSRDHAFNVEEWSLPNTQTTTFYTWSLGGKLTDNRGVSLAQAPLSINPLPISQARTDQEGNFFSRLKTAGAHTIDVNRSGYGDLAQTSLNLENLAHIYLPPANNALLNGDFEAGQPLANWVSDGSLPVSATTDPRHTGDKSVILGNTDCPYPCLTAGEDSGFNLYVMDMVVDSQGVVHAVFMQSNSIVYASRDTSGNWSMEIISQANGSWPKLTIDQDNELHVLWGNDDQIYYTHRSPGSSWSSPLIVATIADDLDFYHVFMDKLLVDSKGGLHALFKQSVNNTGTYPSLAFYLHKQPNGLWQTPILLTDSGPGYGRFFYDGALMSIGPDDSLHFIIFGQRLHNYWGDYELIYQRRLTDGTWTDKQELWLFNSNFPVYPESMGVTADGVVHMTWSQLMADFSLDTFHAFRAADGKWSTPTIIQLSDDTTYVGPKSYISVDFQGQVHALLQDRSGSNVFYRLWRPESGWQGSILLSHREWDSQELSTAVDQYGIIHLMISDESTAKYFRFLPATVNGTALLSQQVTIPANMPAPTLAFMAQRPGDVAGDDSGLELLVSDGVTTTAVSLANGGAAWTHYWADMSPWAGQTVTVTFQLTQVSGDPRVQAAIDDVTLGSAYPDTWVRGTGPGSALPGETVVFQVQYGNRGRVPAVDGELSISWPETLTFVSASVTPTVGVDTLTWNVGDLAAESEPVTIVVTATVDPSINYFETIDLPVSLSSATSEMEQQNNEVTLTLLIAHRAFLPVIHKP